MLGLIVNTAYKTAKRAYWGPYTQLKLVLLYYRSTFPGLI